MLRSTAAAQLAGFSWKPCQSGALTRVLVSVPTTLPSASTQSKRSVKLSVAISPQHAARSREGRDDSTFHVLLPCVITAR